MKRISFGISLILIFFTFSLFFYNNLNQKYFDDVQRQNNEIGVNPEVSSLIGVINLTNYWINETRHYHNSTITIEGKIFKPIPPPPPYDNLSNINVALVIDGSLDTRFNATSNGLGEFQINYRIPFSLDVFSSHKIEVECIDNLGLDDIIPLNHFIIYVNATSYLDLFFSDIPHIPDESLVLSGYLRYNNENGTGITNEQINYNWYNTSYTWPSSFFFTGATDGSISESILIPADAYSQTLNLNLSYSGNFPFINNTQQIISITTFRDIECIWNTVSKASERDEITITGQILYNNSQRIDNRTLSISYDGGQIGTVDTDINGIFTYTYTIPDGTGNKSIQIDLINTAGKQLNSITYINVTAATPFTPLGLGDLPPFLMFSLIFFPILAGVIAVLAVLGYRYYKKQEKESRVVNLHLESKLINLKILKDSGRLEESLSYLFNAVFMDLINARYNRIKKENETIRDFAIISVKELKLTPAAIYPFIQTVEKIIYGRPFQITEKDFYNTCELFSPIYFQLTGQNFVLNF
jgi:hypothetical protein